MRNSLLLVAVLSFVACSQEATDPVPRPAEELGVLNLVRLDEHLLSAGQPTPEQLAELRALGIERFIHLRPANEEGTGWEEARARELGLIFQRIPIARPEDLTLDNARTLHEALAAAGTDDVFLACSTANRVGGLLALRAFHFQGASAEQALALGKRAGLTRAEPAVRKALGLPEGP